MFEDYNEASSMLRRRTCKILGGGVTEKLFLDTFVTPNNIPFSKGWWLSMVGNSVFFFAVKNQLSEFDNTIRNILSEQGYDVYQIIFQDNDCVIVDGEGNKSIEQFVEDFGLQVLNDDNRSRTGGEPFDRCIDFYNQNGLLTEEARSIYIEDIFLRKYFYSTNIDLFVEDPNNRKPVCVEIKFKDEFSHNNKLVFGEDQMQYEKLFPILRECEIDSYNCILYNYLANNDDDDNTDTKVFEFLDNCGGNLCWKKTLLTGGEEYPTFRFSNRNTPFIANGNTEDFVYCIPLTEYTTIGDSFFEDANNNYWGPCQEEGCTGHNVIRQNRNNGRIFMGCTQYWNHR